MSQNIVRSETRTNKLIPFIKYCYDLFYKIDFNHRRPLLNLINILNLRDDATGIRNKLEKDGINQEKIKKNLQDIIEDDVFLEYCCGNEPLNLCLVIDKIFFRDESPLKLAKAYVDIRCEEFSKIIYESGKYEKKIYCHVFNLGDVHFPLGSIFGEFEIESLNPYQLPLLIGESSLFSSIHPFEFLSFFLTKKDSLPCNNDEIQDVLHEAWSKALYYIRPLQYLRDEPIYIDYVTLIFSPPWLNYVRREGIFLYGRPIRPLINYNYPLTTDVLEDLEKWYLLLKIPGILEKIDTNYMKAQEKDKNKIPAIRKTIYLAGSYFESYSIRESLSEQFLTLVFAFEALFSPIVESTFRSASYAATLLKRPSKDRFDLYNFIVKMMKSRADLVHGRKLFDELNIGELEIRKFASIIRESILSYICLYLRGLQKREKVWEKLERLSMGEEEYNLFENEKNIKLFTEETLRTPTKEN